RELHTRLRAQQIRQMLGSDSTRLVGDEPDPLAGKGGETRRGERLRAGGDGWWGSENLAQGWLRRGQDAERRETEGQGGPLGQHCPVGFQYPHCRVSMNTAFSP